MKLEKQANANEEKTFGVLKKITLDKQTNTLKSKSVEDNKEYLIPKENYFELNVYDMTFGYKDKPSDKVFKRSFGYKQVYKYTLKLNSTEDSLCQSQKGEYKLGLKLLFENKSMLLFCKTVLDLKMWVEAFKKFFDKKDEKLKELKIQKGSKVNKLIEEFNICKTEMEEEREVFWTDYEQKEREKIDVNKLKNQVTLLGEDKNIRIYNDILKENNDRSMSMNGTMDFEEEISLVRGGNTHTNIKREILLAGDDIPQFNETFQNLAKRDLDKEKEEEIITVKSSSVNVIKKPSIRSVNAVLSKVERKPYIPKYTNEVKEIKIRDSTTVKFKEDASTFIFEMNHLIDQNDSLIFQNVDRPKDPLANDAKNLSIFPKYENKHIIDRENEQNYEDPNSIDYQHFKPSLSINTENNVSNVSDNEGPNKKSYSLVDSPHFSNISIIAQRFNKIDNIDDWKLYLNK